jgi:3-oxoacyl-ACP reductase-like protein
MASSMPVYVGAATNFQVCSNSTFASAERQIVKERGRPVIPACLQRDLKRPMLNSLCSVPSSEWQLPKIRFARRKRLLFREAKPLQKVVSLAASSTPAPVMSDLGTNRWWTDDTIAVVTGGSKSSIGLEIVRKLSKEGVKVVFTSRSGEIASKHVLDSFLRVVSMFGDSVSFTLSLLNSLATLSI